MGDAGTCPDCNNSKVLIYDSAKKAALCLWNTCRHSEGIDSEEAFKRKFVETPLTILEEDGPRGYRFSDDENYAFFNIFWQRVSGHYLIQQRYKPKELVPNRDVSRKLPKRTRGPIPIEILEPDTTESSVDKRCFEILRDILRTKNLSFAPVFRTGEKTIVANVGPE